MKFKNFLTKNCRLYQFQNATSISFPYVNVHKVSSFATVYTDASKSLLITRNISFHMCGQKCYENGESISFSLEQDHQTCLRTLLNRSQIPRFKRNKNSLWQIAHTNSRLNISELIFDRRTVMVNT